MKSYLIPEDQFLQLQNSNQENEPLQEIKPILDSNLTTDIKMRLLNSLLVNKDSPQKLEPINEEYIHNISISGDHLEVESQANESNSNMGNAAEMETGTPEQDLETILRSDCSLVSPNGKVKYENGKTVARSNIEKIVAYLKSSHAVAKPTGAVRVLDYIRTVKPELTEHIINPYISSKDLSAKDLTWKKIRLSSRKSM